MKVVFAMLMGVSLSTAAYSVDCSSGIGQQGFQSGLNSQSAVLDILWNQYGDCYNHEEFLEAADVPTVSSSSSAFVQCRASGMNTALYNKFSDITRECAWDASRSGREMGATMGMILCNVTCGHPYLSGGSFSNIYKQSCNASFTDYVRRNCSHKLNSGVFFFLRSQACQI